MCQVYVQISNKNIPDEGLLERSEFTILALIFQVCQEAFDGLGLLLPPREEHVTTHGYVPPGLKEIAKSLLHFGKRGFVDSEVECIKNV